MGFGFPERHSRKTGSILRQLGRRVGNDPEETPVYCSPHSERFDPRSPIISSLCLVQAKGRLADVGFHPPSWTALAEGERPGGGDVENGGPGMPRHGWQREAAEKMEDFFLATFVWPRLPDEDRAMLSSQGGPMAGLPFMCCLTTFHSNEDGAAMAAARRRKELRCPELLGDQGRARLVVLASEVGGRWSEESREFLRQLAKAKARNVPRAMWSRVGVACCGGAPCWRAAEHVLSPSPCWNAVGVLVRMAPPFLLMRLSGRPGMRSRSV